MIIETQPEAPSGWRELAAARGLFYHDPRWIEGIARLFGYRIHYITAVEAGKLVGGLPVAEVPALFGPRRLVSLPFGYAAGPMAPDAEVADALAARVVEVARDRGIARVELKVRGAVGAPPGFRTVQHYQTYLVDTSSGEAAVWARLHADSTRRSIRKAERMGVETRAGTSVQEWLAMAELQEEASHEHGVPSPPRRFFTEVCTALQRDGLADLYLAVVPTGVIAAGIVVWRGTREWVYAFGASRRALLGYRPNHALIWAALRAALAHGVSLDLGRAAPEQEGLVEFKRRWGGEPIPLTYAYWPDAGGLNVARRDRGTLGLAARVWSALPAPLARRGSFLYRYLG